MGVSRRRGYYSYWTAIGNVDLASDESNESEDDEVLVSEGEELELAFGKLIASAMQAVVLEGAAALAELLR